MGQAPLPDLRHAGPRYPGWQEFQAVRARLDPQGVFTNDYVARVLGPVGASPARPRTGRADRP
nr:MULTISPECIES: D-arabinono-1,4-lactone oxidase [unclassified Streptomyces]